MEPDERPTHLDLFSGIGGFALAAQWAGFRTIGFCEIDKYCHKVLAKNFMADANSRRQQWNGQGWQSESDANASTVLHSPPIFSNIFDLNGRDFAGVFLITGGFPCQPFSVAGKRGGAADDRAVWPEMFRVIREARPAWVLGENVPGLIPMELDNVLSDLEGIGYATRTFVIPACAVDARHRRDRAWIVGRLVADMPRIQQGREIERAERERIGPESESMSDTSSEGLEGQQREKHEGRRNGLTDIRQPVPNAGGTRLEGQREQSGGTGTQFDDIGDHCRWLPEPDVDRVAHGIHRRVDRLKGLGNAIVPQVAYEILREIRKLI